VLTSQAGAPGPGRPGTGSLGARAAGAATGRPQAASAGPGPGRSERRLRPGTRSHGPQAQAGTVTDGAAACQPRTASGPASESES
jgi:hypothetical protein